MKILGVLAMCLFLVGCGDSSPLNVTKPSSTERGEAGAINPARNVQVNCQEKTQTVGGVTVNITNNCNKNNATAEPFVAE